MVHNGEVTNLAGVEHTVAATHLDPTTIRSSIRIGKAAVTKFLLSLFATDKMRRYRTWQFPVRLIALSTVVPRFIVTYPAMSSLCAV